jgi:hypothetical protein
LFVCLDAYQKGFYRATRLDISELSLVFSHSAEIYSYDTCFYDPFHYLFLPPYRAVFEKTNPLIVTCHFILVASYLISKDRAEEKRWFLLLTGLIDRR